MVDYDSDGSLDLSLFEYWAIVLLRIRATVIHFHFFSSKSPSQDTIIYDFKKMLIELAPLPWATLQEDIF